MAKRHGRRKGSRNSGYFYRSGRGWYTKRGGVFVSLCDEHGNRLRDRDTPKQTVAEAFSQWQEANRKAAAVVTSNVTVLEVCTAYLNKVAREGAKQTLSRRSDTLFDFCFGLPAAFREKNGKPARKPKASDKIHEGFGGLLVSELKPLNIDQWLQAHPKWKGGIRSKLQAVKRALNYAVEARMTPANPIRGYKVPKAIGRVTYITPEQEQGLYKVSKPDFVKAIKVCIRTGARPGCEFATLAAKHVKDSGDRMEFIFQPDESKTKILRTIRVMDPEILGIIREQISLNPDGPIFKNARGRCWTRESLSSRFRAAKAKLAKQGIKFDKDAVMYSCRHTFAKRTLQGYWTGKVTNIETLARLMGNSPQVCRDHYLQFCESYSQPLWEAV